MIIKKMRIVLMVAAVALLWSSVPATAGNTATTLVKVGESTSVTLANLIAKGLPVMCVETVDQEEPTCDYVSAPAGCMGAGIANATKVHARMLVYNRVDGVDSVMYDSGDYEKDVSGLTIKLRGNTSAYDVKKPYKIKLQKKFDLLFGGNDSIYKDKEWLLLRDDYLTTTAGMMVNELVGMTWTPRHHFVNVVINGSYRGVYLLCESVKRNPDCRLNVDKLSGYIFECDPYWWNETVYVLSSRRPSYNYTFKYPDDEDITEEQLAYMQSLVTAYEASLNNATYTDYIDVRSFAGWCLVHDIMGTNDSGGANMFYTKYDTTAASKIVMPLAWDFDMSYRTTSAWSRSHVRQMDKLLASANRKFVDEFVALWRAVGSTLVADATSYMTAFRQSPEGVGLNNSFLLDQMVYNRSSSVYNHTAGCISWMTTRQAWLNTAINALSPLGDVNIDGKVNINDVTSLINLLLNGNPERYHSADVNQDGTANISDVTTLINQLLAG